jgi:predicted DNA-binding ribbon-helix-helix protein
MRSSVIKRSLVVDGRKTSVSLEDAFWGAFKEIAKLRDLSLSELAGEVNSARQCGNLSSAIRLYVLDHCRQRLGYRSEAERTRAA